MPYYGREVEIALEDLGLLGVGEKRRQHEEDEEDENGEPDAPASEPPKA